MFNRKSTGGLRFYYMMRYLLVTAAAAAFKELFYKLILELTQTLMDSEVHVDSAAAVISDGFSWPSRSVTTPTTVWSS